MSRPDPKTLPTHLRPYTYVKGTILSAPLDMPSRLDEMTKKLKDAGWTVYVRSVGTDFSGPLGIPVPKAQPIELLIHRTDKPYFAIEAEAAVIRAMADMTWNYSPLERYAGEIQQEVITPTVKEVAQITKTGASLAIPVIVAFALFYVYTLLPKRK